MKRISACLIPWMVLTASVGAQVRAADVFYTCRGLTAQRAFRLGDECFFPVDQLDRLGWNATIRSDQAEIDAEKRHLTVPVRIISGRSCIALRPAISSLGAQAAWVPGSDVLEVTAEAKTISFHDGRFEARFGMGVKTTAFVLTSPSRAVVDIEGAKLTDGTKLDLESNARAIQWKTNVVRVYIETSFTPLAPQEDLLPGDTARITFGKVKEPEAPEKAPATVDIQVPPERETPEVAPPVGESSGPLPLVLDIEGPSATLLSIRFPSAFGSPQFTKPDPTTLEIILPGVQMDLPDDFSLDTNSVVSATTRRTATGTILTLQLPRPMGAEVWGDGTVVQIQLLKPEIGNGRLAGKIVVVDPGHGGSDAGAHSGNVREKDLTLPIARFLSAQLAAQGATVIMTRKDDVAVPLTERAAIANRNRADFFISCHINSSARPSMSGTLVFHHKGRTNSQVLAECILPEIGKVSGIPARGVWSDGKIYNSGFSVLRNSKMTGVLVEFGFINQATDRARMVRVDFQKAVAAAIVRGLRVYLGDAKDN